MAAGGSLLEYKGKKFGVNTNLSFYWIDQRLGVSQFILIGTLSNVTLSKRHEMLDKPSIDESLNETLLFLL